MKQAMIYTNVEVRRRNLDVLKVCDVHDEHQYDCLETSVEPFTKEVLPIAFSSAGKSFQYRLPIDCTVQIGKTWSETH